MLDRLLSISFPVEVFSLERTFSFGYDSCCVNVMTMKIYMDTSHPEGLHSAIYTVLSLESLSRSSEKRVLLSHTLAMPQIINAKLRNPAVSTPPDPPYTDCQDELHCTSTLRISKPIGQVPFSTSHVHVRPNPVLAN
jgi:hypothetical protein